MYQELRKSFKGANVGNLFLSGGGDKEQTKVIDQTFIEQINPNKPILYIPIALVGAVPYEDCLKWITGIFNPMGLKNITMWTDLKNKTSNDLKQFSAIYIGGGNTFRLLKDLRHSKFDKVLMEYIKGEGVIYGGSAGAIILGANIMTCAHMDPNNVNLQDYDGFNLVSDYSIWCHYQVENDNLIRSYIENYKRSVIALPEETGIFFSNEGIKVIGTSPAYIFKNEDRKVVLPSEFI